MTVPVMPRRNLISGAGLAVLGGAAPAIGFAGNRDAGDEFHFEISRSESEWQARLTPREFHVLRRGGTEEPRSSPLWQETGPGIYSCKGCDLPLYDGKWKTVRDAGWLFFTQSDPNALLMGIDRPEDDGTVSEMALDQLAMVEVHCRRCGSHHGHIVSMDDTVLHCVNGVSLRFAPAAG